MRRFGDFMLATSFCQTQFRTIPGLAVDLRQPANRLRGMELTIARFAAYKRGVTDREAGYTTSQAAAQWLAMSMAGESADITAAYLRGYWGQPIDKEGDGLTDTN